MNNEELISYLNNIDFENSNIVYNEIKKLVKENQELKKQLENNSKINVADHKYASTCEDKVIILENQQKEFIKYLEDEIEKATTNSYTKLSEYGMNRIHIYKEILQKYKSIIGVSNENN